MEGNPERSLSLPCGSSDEWLGMADEWPQSVNPVTPKPYIIGAREDPAACRAGNAFLQTPAAVPIFHARVRCAY